jgi:hypothetical protein
MNVHRYLVCGLQSSGKTTFAAALWHLLDSRDIPTALEKGKHTGDFHYLEEITQTWSEGWRVERTKSGQIEDVRINLRHASSQTDLALEFADLSGESFEGAFATRLCMPKFVDVVNAASGILLFVSADRMVDSVTILDAFPEENLQEGSDEGTGEVEIDWDPAKTPHQIQLVDFLEALRSKPFSKLPLKVAVIVSAWDLADEWTPEGWLGKRLPLLAQYLRHREWVLDSRVYGVSAQGGELSQKGEPPTVDRDRLLSMPASQRIQIVGRDVMEHDLTHPILWLSGLGQRV